MSLTSANSSVRRTALLGNRARRSQAANLLVVRLVPWAAAVACSASAIGLLVGGPRLLGPVLLSAIAIAAVSVSMAARFDRRLTDETVAELDRTAGLGGALRSAHWFASHQSVSQGEVSDAWLAFHIERAAAESERVDWAAVYARPSTARAWGATAVLGTVALMIAWESPRRSPLSDVKSEQSDSTVTVIPSHLIGQITEGMKVMQDGGQPSKDVMTAVGQALEIAKNDKAARRELEDLFAQLAQDRERRLLSGSWVDSGQRDDLTLPWDEGTPAPEWAYEEAIAKASVQQPEAAAADPESSSTNEGGSNREREPGLTGSATSDSAAVPADTRGKAGSFSSMLFGRQRANEGEPDALREAVPAAQAALLAALRREVIHARSDVADSNRVPTVRGRPNPPSPPRVGSPAEPARGQPYDVSKAGRPPVVPDARRALLHAFFARVADDAALSSQR